MSTKPQASQIIYQDSTVETELDKRLPSQINVKFFGVVGDGIADDTVAMQSALDALAAGESTILGGMAGLTIKLSDSITMRSTDKTIDGTGSSLVLTSTTAGFRIAGNRNKIRGFKVSQSSQDITPTFCYIFNDVTTSASNYNRVEFCTGDNVYRGIHAYMGNTSGAAYRHSIIGCIFRNTYLAKTWSGSFGVSFDGPGSGNAAGNDSKVIDSQFTGYENNYIINNSIGTQLIGCSGDGGGSCIKYSGNSSGLRIIGGYYEYNNYFINVTDGTKYDAYLLYPSVGSTVTSLMLGDTISNVCGGWGVGVSGNPIDISNGFFKTQQVSGKANVTATNGVEIYSGVSPTLRASANSSGTWTFNGTANYSGTINVDNIRVYTGGATPFKILNTSTSASSKIVFGTNSIDRVEIPYSGNLRPTTDSSISLGEATNRWTYVHAYNVRTHPVTVANLPAAATAGVGTRSFVTDANATTFASVVVGGGSNAVPVYSDGTDWRIG